MDRRQLVLGTLAAAAPLAAAPALAQAPQPRTPPAKTWTDRTFTARDGLVIHYIEQGQGVPVILIHGLTSSAVGNWFNTGVGQRIARTNRVIAVDMRGHGQTPQSPEGSTGYMINDIVQLMDSLRIEKAHIAGYSMGGATTCGLMREAPSRFITAGVLGIGVTHAPGATGPEATAGQVPDMGATRMRAPRGAPAPSQRVDLTTINFPVIAINGTNDNPGKVEPLFRHVKDFTNILVPDRNHMQASGDPMFGEKLSWFIAARNPA